MLEVSSRIRDEEQGPKDQRAGRFFNVEFPETIGRIFEVLSPERITLGTLRFQREFWRMRERVVTTGEELVEHMDRMVPMFEPRMISGKTKVGKSNYLKAERAEIFGYAVEEVRKHTDCTIALCKESAAE